jgi:hypothetical protein
MRFRTSFLRLLPWIALLSAAPARASWDDPYFSLWVGPVLSESHIRSEAVIPAMTYPELGLQGMAGVFSERWVFGVMGRIGAASTRDQDFRMQEQELGPAVMFRSRRFFAMVGLNLFGQLSLFRDNPDLPGTSYRSDTTVYKGARGLELTAGLEILQSIYANLTVRNLNYSVRDDIWNKTARYEGMVLSDQSDHVSGFAAGIGISVLY